jgi:lipid II:glycine glycyltransferase (peptidoglycan interpeptide bridge formation enzyme)
VLDLHLARALFSTLPGALQIGTLSPDYVTADAIRDPSHAACFIAYQETDRFWLHSLHLDAVPALEGWSDLQSAYGYGGPVANTDDSAFIQRAWHAYQGWCREKRILAEFVRFHPMADNWRLYRGEIREDRQTVAIALNGAEPDSLYEIRCRTAVRKAVRHQLETSWLPLSSHLHKFADFYRDSMARIGAAPAYLFNNDYFDSLAKNTSPRLLVCHQNNSWLAAALFLDGAEMLEYHLSGASEAGRKLCATNLLLHTAAEAARQEGKKWLFLGGGTDSQPDNPLFFFKAGFSPHRFQFRIGHEIHASSEYERLKARLNADANPRVLFYRKGI